MSTITPPASIADPWGHRDVRAGGASFHVAISGDDPSRHSIILLHDFPTFWWYWRGQLVDLADAGYRVVAVDLRGYGGSDFQPGEVSLVQLAQDVIGVARATGTGPFTVVGSGIGGSIAWMIAHMNPAFLRSAVTLCSPHPLAQAYPLEKELGHAATRIGRLKSGELVTRALTSWCAPDSRTRMEASAATYGPLFGRAFAANAALQTIHGVVNLTRADKKALSNPVSVRMDTIIGQEDGLIAPGSYAKDSDLAKAPIQQNWLTSVGHFPAEESSDAVSQLLLAHLSNLH